ncbi:hypothetical protein [Variovorax sp. PAMC 28711]|nr:hypothetical protein [Variovorax sp. PAMC 28711]
MTLICKPKGRGNWHTVVIQTNLPPDLFRVQAGHTFELGGRVLRVCEVRP